MKSNGSSMTDETRQVLRLIDAAPPRTSTGDRGQPRSFRRRHRAGQRARTRPSRVMSPERTCWQLIRQDRHVAIDEAAGDPLLPLVAAPWPRSKWPMITAMAESTSRRPDRSRYAVGLAS